MEILMGCRFGIGSVSPWTTAAALSSDASDIRIRIQFYIRILKIAKTKMRIRTSDKKNQEKKIQKVRKNYT